MDYSTTFLNQRPWMNRAVSIPLDRTTRTNLRRRIKLRIEDHSSNNSNLDTCGKVSRPSRTTNPNQQTLMLQLLRPCPDRTTRRRPTRLISLQTNSPSYSPPSTCMPHWVGIMHVMLLALMASLDTCSVPVLGSWLRTWMTSSTCHWPKQLSPYASIAPLLCWCQNIPVQQA